jgi:hypothetical protein
VKRDFELRLTGKKSSVCTTRTRHHWFIPNGARADWKAVEVFKEIVPDL